MSGLETRVRAKRSGAGRYLPDVSAPALRPFGWTGTGLAAACWAWFLLTAAAQEQAESPPAAARPEGADATATAVYSQLVRVPLPITGDADKQLERMVNELLLRWENRIEPRPILVLEFGTAGEATSRGSQFERALAMARFLSSGRLSSVRVVAYLTGRVEGHAVLPVLACEEILAHPDAELGKAGIDDEFIDETVRGAYRDLARRRRTVPEPVAMAMLDGRTAVYKVQTLEGVRFASEEELDSLRKSETLRSEERVVPAGEAAMFSGSDLRLKFGFVSHLARNRAELATALRLPPGGIDEDPTLGQGRRGIRVDVRGPIRADVTTWIERSLREAVERDQVNLICLVIDSPGGSPADSVRLAQYLAGLDASRVRTLAYVAHEARADAALIALACHQLVLGQDAVLGGPGAERVRGQRLEDLRVILRDMARTSGKNWSLPLAMLDRDLEVRRYTREGTGEVRYFCAEELSEQPDADRWKAGPLLRTSAGLRGPEAVEAGLARTVAEDFPEFQRLYQFEETLPSLRPTWAHRLIEFLAKPQVAGTLLFIGFFALMIETMSPGIGLPGFISAVSFLLFFWANFLHGTAGWLEILLFAAGLGCLALEIFVLPGFGVFGVGGILLVMASIVLASQTFVIPRNAYEWNQLPTSLYMLVAAGTGGFASLILVRKFVSRAPLFRRVALETPDGQSLERLRYQEALVHFDHLLGKRGVAATQLTPCGKAQFGDDVVDVISDGDLIPRGSDIVVTEIRGNEIVVKALEV